MSPHTSCVRKRATFKQESEDKYNEIIEASKKAQLPYYLNNIITIQSKGDIIMKKYFAIGLTITIFAASFVYAHEKVKLTGYITDAACASKHLNDKSFASTHTKDCALKESCANTGYGIFVDGKWYPFNAKGNALAKSFLEKSNKKDHLKAVVTGMEHEGKILVDSIVAEQ